MPCYSMRKPNQTAQERVREVEKVIETVEELITSGDVTIRVNGDGVVFFEGLQPWVRDGVNDTCMFEKLYSSDSFAIQTAFEQAELECGFQINPEMMAAGWHTHDQGRTIAIDR